MTVWVIASVAALGGLLFGYDTGVISGALLFVSPEFNMSPAQEGLVTSTLLIGATLGALSGGRLADALGRRSTLILGGLVFVLGSLWCAWATSTASLAWARAFLGLAVGAVSIVVPMYIAENAPAGVRGRMVSLNTLMIVVGQLAAYLVNSLLATTGSWRLMLGMAAVPGLILVIGMLFMPDTPAWLARRGRLEEAQSVARRLGQGEKEVQLLAEVEEGKSAMASEWRALKGTRWIQVAVLIAALIGVVQQITGVNAVVYFAPTMMNALGLSTENSIYTAIVIGVVSVVACWVGLQIIDLVGRRRLLTAGLIINIISLVLVALTYRAAENNPSLALLTLALMAVFIASQQAGVSPTTWLLISEIVPIQARGIGMGLAGLMLWVANWAVAQFFLPVVEAVSATGAFFIFAGLGLVALGFVRAYVPETKGRTLEDVGESFEARFGSSSPAR